MDRKQIQSIAGREMARITDTANSNHVTVFRSLTPEDETDRIGKRMVRRLMEAGVAEPL